MNWDDIPDAMWAIVTTGIYATLREIAPRLIDRRDKREARQTDALEKFRGELWERVAELEGKVDHLQRENLNLAVRNADLEGQIREQHGTLAVMQERMMVIQAELDDYRARWRAALKIGDS